MEARKPECCRRGLFQFLKTIKFTLKSEGFLLSRDFQL